MPFSRQPEHGRFRLPTVQQWLGVPQTPLPHTTTHPFHRRFALPLVVQLASCLCILPAAAMQFSPTEPPIDAVLPSDIFADVNISCTQMTTWSEPSDLQVVMLQGDVRLDMGGRTATADSAVIWFTTESGPRLSMRIYFEGNARVVEPGGATALGDRLLLRVRVGGTLYARADGRSMGPQHDDPLYQRALRAREVQKDQRPITPRPQFESEEPLVGPSRNESGGEEFIWPNDEQEPVVKVGPPAERGPVPAFDSLRTEPVHYAADRLHSDLREEQRLTTLSGNVYLTQEAKPGESVLELRAENAVVFSKDVEPTTQDQKDKPVEVTGVYLEGDVVLTRGQQMLRGARMYYHFPTDQAVLIQGVLRTVQQQRNVPIYVRAEVIHQYSRLAFSAREARLSTDEFNPPHYHIGATTIYLNDQTPRDSAGRPTDNEVIAYKLENATLNLRNVPVMYWPVMAGTMQRSETALKGVRTGLSGRQGAFSETDWHLFQLLGRRDPEGFDTIFNFDFYQESGFGLGIQSEYQREDYFGQFKSYLVTNDNDLDDLGRERDNIRPDNEIRGRLGLQHRHYLPDDWELTLELNYISDPTFMEEWHEKEFDTGKSQESVFRLKKQEDNWAWTNTLLARLNEFDTQTEMLPESAFYLLGQSLLDDHATFFGEARAGILRRRVDDRVVPQGSFGSFLLSSPESSEVVRIDARNEIQFPFSIGSLEITPYGSTRASFYDDGTTIDTGIMTAPDVFGPRQTSGNSGNISRFLATWGARASTQFSRIYNNVHSRLLDLNRIRHILKPEAHVFFSESNQTLPAIYPFNQDIEAIDDVSGYTIALRQRWQTKRGPEGEQRTVDWIVVDVSATFFDNADAERLGRGFFYPHFITESFAEASSHPLTLPTGPARGYFSTTRPELSIPRDHIRTDVAVRASDTTSVLGDANYDPTDQELDTAAIGVAVDHWPRFGYYMGARYINLAATQSQMRVPFFDSNQRELESLVLSGSIAYKINKKYAVGLGNQYDLQRRHQLGSSAMIIRRFPRWFGAVSFDFDTGQDFSIVTVSIWPEGIPEITLGSRANSSYLRSMGLEE